MVPYMVTDRDAQGMRVDHVKDLSNCHRSATDRHRQVCRCKDCTKDWSCDCFLIRKPFSCQSVADPVMFLQIFIGPKSIKDERDATRTSRMGLGTIRTLMDELRMRYG